jgi:hypothetical protein
MAMTRGDPGTSPAAGLDGLVAWAEGSGRRGSGGPARGGLRFVFYAGLDGEWQDLEFFGAGESRTVAGARRPLPWPPGWQIRAGLGGGL